VRASKNYTRLVYALSGLGKTELCEAYPDVTFDTDVALQSALAVAFPELTPPACFLAWRELAQTEPWKDRRNERFVLWADTRRRFVSAILAVLEAPKPKLVLTNMVLIPWRYERYFGVELGQYEAHWEALERGADNDQVEARNNYLEGFAPLTRLPAGSFLANDPDIQSWIAELIPNEAYATNFKGRDWMATSESA
jgi:hypothetical protein